MKDIVVIAGAVVGVVALIVGLSALFALPVMWLWNYVVPYQFGLKEIDFLHAWALMVLCNFIFNNSTYSSQKKD
jgi:hypothetical protein